jgi:hypothetical protein
LSVARHGSEVRQRLERDLRDIRAARYRSFISYSHEETAEARRLHGLIDKHAHRVTPVFFAEHSIAPGMNWFAELTAALESMECIFVVFSPQSFQRHWLHVECGAALASNKRLVPVLHGALAHTDLPSPYSLYQSTLRLDGPEELLIDELSRL